MFAPVVHRFRTYAIEVAPQARAYMDTMMAQPAFAEWTQAGLAETLLIERFELYRHGQGAVIALSSAVGSDNVDPWRIVSESFRWK